MKPPVAPESQKPLPSVELHDVRLCRIIEFGTQPSSDPKYSPAFKVKLDYELVNTNQVFKEGDEPKPFMLDFVETFSLGERANFRKKIFSWAGRSLTAVEIENFDLKRYLNAPGQILPAHYPSTKNPQIIKCKIGSIIPPRLNPASQKPFKVAPLRNPMILFSLQDPSECSINGIQTPILEVFKLLNKWEQQNIEKSPEWRALNISVPVTTATTTSNQMGAEAAQVDEDEDPQF
jgi:hypothetical protein